MSTRTASEESAFKTGVAIAIRLFSERKCGAEDVVGDLGSAGYDPADILFTYDEELRRPEIARRRAAEEIALCQGLVWTLGLYESQYADPAVMVAVLATMASDGYDLHYLEGHGADRGELSLLERHRTGSPSM